MFYFLKRIANEKAPPSVKIRHGMITKSRGLFEWLTKVAEKVFIGIKHMAKNWTKRIFQFLDGLGFKNGIVIITPSVCSKNVTFRVLRNNFAKGYLLRNIRNLRYTLLSFFDIFWDGSTCQHKLWFWLCNYVTHIYLVT